MKIRNCIFKFRCTKTWDSLIQTTDANIRYCNECDKGVHFCDTEHDLLEAVEKDWCIAIRFSREDKYVESVGNVMLDPENRTVG